MSSDQTQRVTVEGKKGDPEVVGSILRAVGSNVKEWPCDQVEVSIEVVEHE
jgi:hypothetical protein